MLRSVKRGMPFYVYVYLDEWGRPYYVGKGTRSRDKAPHNGVTIPPNDRILRCNCESEDDALLMEYFMINSWWDRLTNKVGFNRKKKTAEKLSQRPKHCANPLLQSLAQKLEPKP